MYHVTFMRDGLWAYMSYYAEWEWTSEMLVNPSRYWNRDWHTEAIIWC